MEWQQWDSVAFVDRKRLPITSGIYVVADKSDFVWYVGQATNLQSRWISRSHHRYPQLIRTNKKLGHRIYWRSFPAVQLDEKERYFIDLLRPELNGCKVKTYLPKQPQVEREIKRLFKVLNKTTLLFPVLRSLVVGEYVDENGVRCVMTVLFINDEKLLNKSIRKRYSAEVRRAWIWTDCLCGRSSDTHKPPQLVAYEVGGERFEFVFSYELLRYLEDNPDVYKQTVATGVLFGVEVTALRSLEVLDQVTLEEKYNYLRRDEKKGLTSVAYLRYRRTLLRPLSTLLDKNTGQ